VRRVEDLKDGDLDKKFTAPVSLKIFSNFWLLNYELIEIRFLVQTKAWLIALWIKFLLYFRKS